MRNNGPGRTRSPLGRALPFVAAALLAGVQVPAHAATLKFVPLALVMDVEPRRQTLTISNSGSEKATVQLQMMKWTQDSQGKDVYELTRDLVYFPQIITLAPGGQSIVRVGYEPKGQVPTEKSYRLFIQELPIAAPGQNVIRIAMRVGIPVFLAPPDPHAVLTVLNARVEEGTVMIDIRNTGNSHSMVRKIALQGLDESGREVFVKELDGWYVLPGVAKEFPLGLTAAECRTARTVKVKALSADLAAEGQIDVDPAWAAQLEGAEKAKEAARKNTPGLQGTEPPSKP